MTSSFSCQWIGHATVRMNVGPTTLVTDLHLGKRVILFPRRVPLTVDWEQMDRVNAVLLTHTHYDHLHVSSYRHISTTVPIILPEGSERAVGPYLHNPIVELAHFAEHTLPDGTLIRALPVIHPSSRVSHLRFRTTNAYLIRRPESPGAVYFCADSAYGPHFAEAGGLGPIDVAFLHLGGYSPRFLMKHCHTNPQETVQAFDDLKAAHLIPIHHATFRWLSFEPAGAPVARLMDSTRDRPDLAEKIHLLAPGDSWTRP